MVVKRNKESSLRDKTKLLQSILISRATGGLDAKDDDYEGLRKELLNQKFLPEMVKVNRDLSQFWSLIKRHSDTYQERREFIWSEFSPMLNPDPSLEI